jgi:hypothetical protein
VEVLEALRRLEGDDRLLRLEAVCALGRMGEAAAVPEVIRALLATLRDGDADLRGAAVWALGSMGEAAAAPEVLEALAERLWDEDPLVCDFAADVLRGIWGEAAIVLGTLLGPPTVPGTRRRSGGTRQPGRTRKSPRAKGLSGSQPPLLDFGGGR